ncbi:780_t:CDS:2, partial [Scutellospora calospora]
MSNDSNNAFNAPFGVEQSQINTKLLDPRFFTTTTTTVAPTMYSVANMPLNQTLSPTQSQASRELIVDFCINVSFSLDRTEKQVQRDMNHFFQLCDVHMNRILPDDVDIKIIQLQNR